MEMTIKQLAAELNVSKPTIRKIITKLGFWDDICKVGNRYVLSEEQISQIKSRIEPVKSETESVKSQTTNEKSQTTNEKSQTEPVRSETTNQNALIDVLQKQLFLLNEQLSIKDDQIRAYQEQIRILTDSLHDATTALSAEQALHAGTIQRQLNEQISSKENSVPEDPEQPKQKQGFFSKFFGKKNN